MTVLIPGFFLFFFALISHLIIWRVKCPVKPYRGLFFIFTAVGLPGIFFLFHIGICGVGQCFHTALLYFSLFLCYVITYSAIQADSPSIVIVMKIFKSGKSGLRAESIATVLGDDVLVDPRLKDLVDARLVDLEGPLYRINSEGRSFIRPFMLFREFLGLGKGG